MLSKSALKLTSLILLTLVLFPADSTEALDTINLGPLLYIEKDKEKGTYELNALGPLVNYKRGEQEKGYGLRPIFYRYKDFRKDRAAFDFLYPLSGHRRFGDDTKFQMLMYLIHYKNIVRNTGYREWEFNFLPFIFTRKSDDPERGYFAFFPFGGKLKQKFSKDQISFFLFPIFLQTKKHGITNNNIVWPFFGYYTGDGVSGGRFWPLYGTRKKAGTFSESFALWPFYLAREKKFMGEHASVKAFLPFYYRIDMPSRKQRTYLWPFINKIENTEKDFQRSDTPWFFATFSRGSVHTNRVWPFYAKTVEEDLESGFVMWPIYQYRNIQFGRHLQKKKRIALFIYKDKQEIATAEGGKSGRTINLWPLFTYKSKTGGPAYFRFISPLETFLSDNKPRERNWAPIWTVFTWERDEEGNEMSSLLWNLFRTEHTRESTKIELRPIIPLISIESGQQRSKFYLLGGLLGYKRVSEKKSLRFLYIPVTISSGKGSAASARYVKTMVLGDV